MIDRAFRGLALRHRATLWLATLWLAVTHPVMMVRHRRKMGSWPNPGRPKSYSEKVMWRKLLDRNPLFVTATDKLTAKDYIGKLLADLPQPRLLWVGDSAAAVPDSVMRGPALVKPTNGSGRNFLVRDGQPDRESIGNATRHLLAPGGYRRREEWAYWPVKGRLLAEEVLPLGGDDLPTDLKLYVASGRVCVVWANDKPGRRSLSLTPAGEPLPGRDDMYPGEDSALPLTERLVALTREASCLALPLAAEFDMVRVDFLVTRERLYAGELTIYSSGGYDIWHNPDIPARIADAWDLRDSWFMRQPHSGLVGLYAEALSAAEAGRMASLSNKPPSISR